MTAFRFFFNIKSPLSTDLGAEDLEIAGIGVDCLVQLNGLCAPFVARQIKVKFDRLDCQLDL